MLNPVVVALLATYLFWGSTYAAMRLTDQTIPPLLMAGTRFLIASAILWLVVWRTGAPRLTAAQWRTGAVTGTSMLVLGNGAVVLAVTVVPTGIAALLLSISPLWMALFDFALTRTAPSPVAIGGMVLGVVGMGLLFAPHLHQTGPLLPMLALVAGSIAWAFGSIYSRQGAVNANLLVNAAMQMTVGGAILLVAGFALGEGAQFAPARISGASLGAFAFLILFGSIVGYSAYLYVLRNGSVSLAASQAYASPLVAIVLGVAIFRETITVQTLVAAAVILGGVALMVMPKRTARLVDRQAALDAT